MSTFSSTPIQPPRHRVVTAKLIDAVPGVHDVPELQEHVGRWLVAYKPELCKAGEQWLWTTDDRSEALRLPFPKMWDLLKTSIGIREHDGRPDRPISIFHVQIDATRETASEPG